MREFALYLLGMSVSALMFTAFCANPDWPDWTGTVAVLAAIGLGAWLATIDDPVFPKRSR